MVSQMVHEQLKLLIKIRMHSEPLPLIIYSQWQFEVIESRGAGSD